MAATKRGKKECQYCVDAFTGYAKSKWCSNSCKMKVFRLRKAESLFGAWSDREDIDENYLRDLWEGWSARLASFIRNSQLVVMAVSSQ